MYTGICLYACVRVCLYKVSSAKPWTTRDRHKAKPVSLQTALQECKVCYALSGWSKRGHSLLFALGLLAQFCQGGELQGQLWKAKLLVEEVPESR